MPRWPVTGRPRDADQMQTRKELYDTIRLNDFEALDQSIIASVRRNLSSVSIKAIGACTMAGPDLDLHPVQATAALTPLNCPA